MFVLVIVRTWLKRLKFTFVKIIKHFFEKFSTLYYSSRWSEKGEGVGTHSSAIFRFVFLTKHDYFFIYLFFFVITLFRIIITSFPSFFLLQWLNLFYDFLFDSSIFLSNSSRTSPIFLNGYFCAFSLFSFKCVVCFLSLPPNEIFVWWLLFFFIFYLASLILVSSTYSRTLFYFHFCLFRSPKHK